MIRIVKLLIDSRCDVNICDNTNTTALMYYLQNIGSEKSVLLSLIYKSNNVKLKNNEGKPAYDYYVENNYDLLNGAQLRIIKI